MQLNYKSFFHLPLILIFVFVSLETFASEKPNILFIMIDDLGWKDLNCQGNSSFTTPNIDRLSSEGMTFTDAYAASPVCSPTRAASISGLYPARLKITQHGEDRWSFYSGKPSGPGKSTGILKTSYETIAEKLQKNGYQTGFVGKWHLSGHDLNEKTKQFLPDNQGFDINIAGNGWGGPGGVGGFFSPYLIPNLTDGPKGEYLPYRLADEARGLLTEYAKNKKPFFMCLWHYTVHWPIEAPEDLYKKYSKGKPGDVERYQAMVEGMDDAVGRTLKALDDLKLAENTIVVFTSDNGPLSGYTSAAPLRESKGHLYEGGIRVPLFVRWPGKIKKKTVSHSPVLSIDFAPTFMEAAGIGFDNKDFDGASLLGELKGESPLEREAVYFHYPHYAFHKDNFMGSVIRMGDYKLLHNFEKNSYELYNLKMDIGETKNLVSSLPEKFGFMKKKLLAWKEETGASNPRAQNLIDEKELLGKKPKP